MSHAMPIDSAVQDAAFEWLAEANSGAPLAGDRRLAFQAWLDADPAHADAFAQAQTLWADLDWAETLNAPAFDRTGASLSPPSGVSRRPRAGRAAPARRVRNVAAAAIAAGLAFALVAGPGVYRMATQVLQVQTMEAATGTGEIRHIALADGSRVTLGGRSSVRIRFAHDKREVQLLGGDAYFEVAPDAQRPFIVRNGGLAATAVGTAFEVNHGDSVRRVSVTEGLVRAITDTESVMLTAGHRARWTPGGALTIEAFDPTIAGRWREQRAAFRDAPLGQVVETLNRYHPHGVFLADPTLADLPVSGAFRFDQMELALNAIGAAQGLRVQRDGEMRLVIDRAG